MWLVGTELSKSFGQWREVAASRSAIKRAMGGALKRMVQEGMNRAGTSDMPVLGDLDSRYWVRKPYSSRKVCPCLSISNPASPAST